MGLREKRKLEVQIQKDQRKEEVIKAAISVFKINGIDNTKMTDIADKAQIGVATLYRYFKTKSDLAIETGVYLWKHEINTLYKDFYDYSQGDLNGRDNLKNALNIFLKIYLEHPEILGLLEHFDNYIVKEDIPISKLANYENSIFDMKFIIIDAIEQGQKDGSLKNNIDATLFYITLTHSLISLSQKLILRGAILKSDSEITGVEQLELIIDMAINYISK